MCVCVRVRRRWRRKEEAEAEQRASERLIERGKGQSTAGWVKACAGLGWAAGGCPYRYAFLISVLGLTGQRMHMLGAIDELQTRAGPEIT